MRDEFLHAGGEKFAHIPCLNDSADGMAVIEALVRRELSGLDLADPQGWLAPSLQTARRQPSDAMSITKR